MARPLILTWKAFIWLSLILCAGFTSAQSAYQDMTIPSTGGVIGGGHPRLLFSDPTVYSAAQSYLYAHPILSTYLSNCSAGGAWQYCDQIAYMHLMMRGTATAYSGNGTTLTITVPNHFSSGQNVVIEAGAGDGLSSLNGQVFAVSATGLSGTQIEVSSSLSGSGATTAVVAYDATPAITEAVLVMTNNTGYPSNCDLAGDSSLCYLQGQLEEALISFDWCYDQMTPTQRSNFLSGANTWFGTFNPNAPMGPASPGTLGYTIAGGGGLDNNVAMSRMRSAFEWGIATYWENTSNAQQNLDFWNTAWTQYKQYVAKTTFYGDSGGVYREGINYGKLVVNNYPIMLYTASQLGRNLYSETAFLQAVPYFYIYGLLPSQTYTAQYGTTCYHIFPWSDGHLNCGTEDFTTDFGIVNSAQTLSTYFGASNAGKLLANVVPELAGQDSGVPYIAALQNIPTTASLSTLPLDYYAPGSGFFWGRNAWDTTSPVVHFELGTNAEVAHYTAVPGTWQLWQNGRFLSRASSEYGGSVTYGWNGATQWSNDSVESVIAVNGIMINPNNQGCTLGTTCQGDGGGSLSTPYVNGGAAPQPPFYQPASVSRLQSATGFDYVEDDISGAYQQGGYGAGFGHTCGSCNPAVQTVIREYVWVRDISTLVEFDRIYLLDTGGVTAGNLIRTSEAHCEVAWNITTANTANCQPGNNNELFLTTLLPATPTPALHDTNETVGPSSNNDGQYRLEINDTPGTAQSYFLNVWQAGTTSTTPLTPTVSLSGGVYTVTLDANHSIQFVQGQFSSGGSITINGTTTPFSSSVEAITASASGVTWGSAPVSLTTSTTGTGSGAVVGCGDAVNSGDSQTCTAVANPGSTFAGWSSGGWGTPSGSTISGAVTANTTVTATFNQAAAPSTTGSSVLLLMGRAVLDRSKSKGIGE